MHESVLNFAAGQAFHHGAVGLSHCALFHQVLLDAVVVLVVFLSKVEASERLFQRRVEARQLLHESLGSQGKVEELLGSQELAA